MPDTAPTGFSHLKGTETPFVSGGLRDFFLYPDIGIAQATHGKVVAHLVRANMAPETGTGWHRHEADFKSIGVEPVCAIPAPTPWRQPAAA